MKLDHTTFNGILLVAAAGVVGFLIKAGSVETGSVLGMLGSTLFNLSFFLCAAFGLQFFQLGIGKNIQEEIFDEHNIAAGIYQGLLFIAIAIIIAKAF